MIVSRTSNICCWCTLLIRNLVTTSTMMGKVSSALSADEMAFRSRLYLHLPFAFFKNKLSTIRPWRDACVAVGALDAAPMIKFSLQCTPDALCYGDHMVTKLTNIMRNILSKTMTNITTNMLIIMTGSDGMNENRDDQFTSGRVPSLGKSSRPYGAKSLSKIANINTAFCSFFYKQL